MISQTTVYQYNAICNFIEKSNLKTILNQIGCIRYRFKTVH